MSAAPVYALHALKTSNGRNGVAFSATLLRDGQPVAEVYDEARGGMMSFDWRDWEAPRVTTAARDGRGQDETIKATPEEARLWAHVLTLPPAQDPTTPGRTFPMDTEWFVNEMVDTALTLKSTRTYLNRVLKTKVVVIREDHTLAEVKVEPTEPALAHIRATYPTVTVLNGRPVEQATVMVLNAGRRRAGRPELPVPTEADLAAPKAKPRARRVP